MGCGAFSKPNVVQPAEQDGASKVAGGGEGNKDAAADSAVVSDSNKDAGGPVGTEEGGEGGPQGPATGRRRRSGVSASTVSAEDRMNWKKPVHEKDDSTKDMLRDIIRTNERLQVLFGHLDEAQTADVIMAMYPGSFSPGDTIIRQGDEGDAFWIVESGQYEIFVYRPAEGAVEKPTPDGSLSLGDKVLSCTKGACFGELALMYNAPRAATVKCKEAGKAWGLDRESFQMMVTTAESTRKKKYEEFLTPIPILKDLNHYEISQLSDMLEPQDHKAGDILMRQGDPGDNFYILESGVAKACLTGDDGNEVVAKVYNSPGDYFGELALLTSAPRRATVYASGDGCRVLGLSKEKFNRVLGPIRRRLEAKMGDYPQYADIIRQQAECEPSSPSDLMGPSDEEEEAPKTKLELLLRQDTKAPQDLGPVRDRRAGVSAPQVSQYEAEHWEKPVFDKTQEEKNMIAKMIEENSKLQVLFGHLQPAALSDVIMAMYPKSVEAGTDVIEQGDVGDAFYIVAEGELHVHVRRPGEDESSKGAKVLELGPGSLFGELALLYNAPRAATVTAVSDSKVDGLWGLDADSFRLMLRTAEAIEPKENEDFVNNCEAFAKLNRFERAELAAVLDRELFDGDEVFARKGDVADRMFILEDGAAIAFDEDLNELARLSNPGSIMGEVGLLAADGKRRASLKAAGEGCSVFTLDKDSFDRMLKPLHDDMREVAMRYSKDPLTEG
ncbi:hypothetical protein FOZ61_004383 [Perkinsus olseni]|uniref:Cyclic nucleotide-binding domain-containing protein n=1 Tax=Perkinsus olseni TaxID=32597 RepID=A0A7J6MCQ7_PEROL|nr:hypothetical protein FOZ61_004383 [Perkinsus olseni]KAF4674641.1 hypothetical protein FOL46_004428 [Perkinsus olseni]